MIEVLESAAREHGSVPAVIADDGSTTYGELHAGLRPVGGRQEVALPNACRWVKTFWSAMAGGAAVVPLNARAKPDEVERLRHAVPVQQRRPADVPHLTIIGAHPGWPATNRKEPDRVEMNPPGMVPIDRLKQIAPACVISRARVVDAGRIITAGGITSGMEMGFHLLRRAGYDDTFISEVARVMEYSRAYELYRDDVELAKPVAEVRL